MICASIGATTSEAAIGALRAAVGADVAELRIDGIADLDLPTILAARALPVVVTCRVASEGGAFTGREAARLALLERACELGAEWIDVEHVAEGEVARDPARTRLILSHHPTRFDRSELERTADEMSARRPDIVKIAVPASTPEDVLWLAALQRRMATPSVLIAVGALGTPLRILYRRVGAAMTYAFVASSGATAPGQVDVDDLVTRHRARAIDDETRVRAVLGPPAIDRVLSIRATRPGERWLRLDPAFASVAGELAVLGIDEVVAAEVVVGDQPAS